MLTEFLHTFKLRVIYRQAYHKMCINRDIGNLKSEYKPVETSTDILRFSRIPMVYLRFSDVIFVELRLPKKFGYQSDFLKVAGVEDE